MSRRDTATRLLALSALAGEINKAIGRAKRQAADEFDMVGVREPGAIGSDPIGHVRVDRGSTSAAVTDEAKFLAWAEANHPDAIETVVRVRPEVQARWLKDAKEHDGVINESTGEIAMPDGVSVIRGQEKLVVAPDRQAADTIRRAIAAGHLDLREVLAIEAGEPS